VTVTVTVMTGAVIEGSGLASGAVAIPGHHQSGAAGSAGRVTRDTGQSSQEALISSIETDSGGTLCVGPRSVVVVVELVMSELVEF
jgi:hypothetical protein